MVEKRNIVLITLDSLRTDHCSFMGYHRETTPTIDRMAKRGLYFENAVASSVGTPSSMFSIFTGDYPCVDAMETNPNLWRKELRKRKTLAEVLSKNGYLTSAFNPNVFVSSYFGFNKGFAYFQDFIFKSEGIFSRIYYKILEKVAKSGKRGFASALRNVRNLVQKEEIFKPWETYYDFIIDWVERAKKPFFLWILLLDTHHPYIAPKKYRKWSNFFTMWYSNWKLQKVKWENKLSNKEREWLINAYDDSIYYADAFIKRLWDDIKDFDPIFIIHADHGEAFGEHGIYGHKPFLYEEFIHVPLVIYNADVKGKIEKPVFLKDLGSTILELVGVKNEFPSRSFLNGGSDWVISKVFEYGKRKIAVRMKDWKFITGQKKEDELYNLKKDPYEQENLIHDHQDLIKEMRKIVERHIKQKISGKIRKSYKLQRIKK